MCFLSPQARPEVKIQNSGTAIRIEDVQALLLWVLADGQSPAWAFVKVKGFCGLRASLHGSCPGGI